MEIQVVNSAQVPVVVTDNLQKRSLKTELHHVGGGEFEIIHLFYTYCMCAYLVVLQIPALDLFVLSTGEQIWTA